MKKIASIEQFDDVVVNQEGVIKILLADGYVELSRECAVALCTFTTKVWDLIAEEAEEEVQFEESEETKK